MDNQEDGRRQLVEALARYIDPGAHGVWPQSKRNRDAARRARASAKKVAKAAIRFLTKPGNLDRLARTVVAAETPITGGTHVGN